MLTLIVAAWMALPLYPLNPPVQDTLGTMNLHLAAGINGPNHLAGPGPYASVKCELLLHHPLVLRGSLDYNYARTGSSLYPDGRLHSATLAAELLVYRGTDQATGYLGAGVVYYRGFLGLDRDAADSIYLSDSITDMELLGKLGLRMMVGLRLSRDISIELGVTEVRPTLRTTTQLENGRYSELNERIRLHDVRLTVGYILPLKP